METHSFIVYKLFKISYNGKFALVGELQSGFAKKGMSLYLNNEKLKGIVDSVEYTRDGGKEYLTLLLDNTSVSQLFYEAIKKNDVLVIKP